MKKKQSDRKQILNVFTYLWNLKNKANECNKTETDPQTQRTKLLILGMGNSGEGRREGQNRGRELRGTNYYGYNK